ncbi:MAG: hypothetical protein WC405_19730 [Syntrophales bacterium]
MKKLGLTLGLILMLTAWGGQGYQGFRSGPAYGQPAPYGPQPYYNPYYYPPPYNYYNYYSAPYADPLSQFLYYVAPQISGEGEREEWEHRGREYYKYRGRGREGFKYRGRGRERD